MLPSVILSIFLYSVLFFFFTYLPTYLLSYLLLLTYSPLITFSNNIRQYQTIQNIVLSWKTPNKTKQTEQTKRPLERIFVKTTQRIIMKKDWVHLHEDQQER